MPKKKLKKTTGIKDGFDNTVTLPSISVNAKDLPALKNKKIDDTFEIVMKVKVTELSKPRWSKDKTLRASLDIVAMSPKGQTYDDEYTEAMSNR